MTDGPFEEEYFSGIYGGDYDARNPKYKFRALLGELRKHQPHGRLLDVGCAYGRFLEVAAEEGGYTLSGTDVSEHAAGVAAERLGDRARVQPGGLLESPFAGETFDVVTMFDVIEHIEDQDAAFARIRELLRPSGLLAAQHTGERRRNGKTDPRDSGCGREEYCAGHRGPPTVEPQQDAPRGRAD